MKKAVLGLSKKQADQESWRLVDGHLMELMMRLAILSAISESGGGQGVRARGGNPDTSSKRVLALTFDLNEKIYESMRYGQDEFELILGVKGSPNARYLIDLDHQTNTPVYLALQANVKGKWVAQKNWRDYTKDKIIRP